MKTKVSHARFYVLLRQIPQASKEELVWQYSHLKTTSLSEFYESNPDGYRKMINDMQSLVNEMNNIISKDEEAKKRHFRSLILGILANRGIVVKNWDYTEVNSIIQHYTKTDKTMKTMSLNELKKAHSQIKKIGNWYEAKQKEIERLQQLN